MQLHKRKSCVAVSGKSEGGFLGECNRNQRRSVPGNGPGRCDSSAHKCRICQLIKRFPVPDGDTGTNMNLSMTSGAKAVADSRSEKVGELAVRYPKGY